MHKAFIKRRTYIDDYRCIDRLESVWYHTKQIIGNLWYLYDQSGYVMACFAKEEIKFND